MGFLDTITSAITGQGEVVRPEKQKAKFAGTTDEEAAKTRGILDEEEAAKMGRIEQAQDNTQTRSDSASALGRTLVNETNKAYDDVNIGNMQRTQVSAPSDRQTVVVDRSRIDTNAALMGPVDTSAVQIDRAGLDRIAAAQGYAPGQGAAAQSALLQALQQQAAGQGPSLATGQFQQAQDSALAASLAQQASLRGGFDPAAARQIRQSAADLQAQAARDAAQARIQEQLAAREQLAGVAGTMETQGLEAAQQELTARGQDVTQRQQDIGMSTQEAQLAQQAKELGVTAETARAGAARDVATIEADLAKTSANLQDKAFESQFQADLEVALKNADLDQVVNSAEFKAETDLAMKQAAAVTGALETAYNGDMLAMREDVEDYNALVAEAMRTGMGMDAARSEFERALIAEGKEARLAQIIADNAHQTALMQFDQAVKDRQAGVAKGLFDLGAKGATTIATGGIGGLGGAGAGELGALGTDAATGGVQNAKAGQMVAF